MCQYTFVTHFTPNRKAKIPYGTGAVFINEACWFLYRMLLGWSNCVLINGTSKLHPCASFLRFTSVRSSCASHLRFASALRLCVSPLYFASARRFCTSSLRSAYALRFCASPLRFASALRLGEPLAAGWSSDKRKWLHMLAFLSWKERGDNIPTIMPTIMPCDWKIFD